MSLQDIRCHCSKLLGKINGRYEIKCPRCKMIISGNTEIKRINKQYDPIQGE